MKTLFLAILLSLSSFAFSQTYDFHMMQFSSTVTITKGNFKITDSTVILFIDNETSSTTTKYKITSRTEDEIKCNDGSSFCTVKIISKKGKVNGYKYETIISFEISSKVTILYYGPKRR